MNNKYINPLAAKLAVGSLVFLAIAGIATTVYTWQKNEKKPCFCDSGVASSSNMQIPDISFSVDRASEDLNGPVKIVIKSNGSAVAELNTEGMVSPEIIKQTEKSVYIGLFPEGVGGYILYAMEPMKAYRLDISQKALTELKGVVEDISSDETMFVGREYDSQGKTLKIVVRKISDGSIVKEFAVFQKYLQAGDVSFSPNGKKIGYAAAKGDADDDEEEESEVFIGDLATGNQVSTEGPAEGVFEIKRWKDNESLFTVIN